MLNYLSSTLPIGNSIYGLVNTDNMAVKGVTFVDDRFALVLVGSGTTAYWSKIDTYTDVITAYEMPFTPGQLLIYGTDQHETVAGSYLASDSSYLYYLSGPAIFRFDRFTGASAGIQTLRTSSGAVIVSNALGAMTMKGSFFYVVSKAQQLAYVYNAAGWAWNSSAVNAVRQVSVPELATYTLCGAFAQPGLDTDFVILMKLGSTLAIAVKYSADLLTRKGQTFWTMPSTDIHGAVFKGSILYVVENNPSGAGTGVLLHRFGDGSTGIVSKESTTLTVTKDRVKAGSGDIIMVTFTAKDGYGVPYSITESVRFSLSKVGEAFDSNDGALATSASGPYRDAANNPINVSVTIPFDVTGKAECYWQAPLDVPVDILLHRIKVKYPV